jgi:hypothetical protein
MDFLILITCISAQRFMATILKTVHVPLKGIRSLEQYYKW